MLSEISLSPSLLFLESYGNEYAHKLGIGSLRKAVLETSLTHNLWNGSFAADAYRDTRISPAGKKLLKAMKTRNRLVEVPPSSTSTQKPTDSISWTKEAVASHCSGAPVRSVLVCPAVKEVFPTEPLVQDLAEIQLSDQWSSQVVRRSWLPPLNVSEYLSLMRPVVRNARYLKLVDAYFNPEVSDYADLTSGLLTLLGERSPRMAKPVLEFHSRHLSEDNRFLSEVETRARYQPVSASLSRLGLRASICIWSDLHDRHILTDLGAYVLGNSLRGSTDKDKINAWARLEDEDADAIDKLYTPESRPNKVVHKLSIGC